jgi:hypothetical protein
MNMKKNYLIAMIIIAVIILIFISIPESWKNPYDAEYSYPIQNGWKACVEDEECSLVGLDCCGGCYHYDVSLNKYGSEAINNWKSWNCVNSYCPLYNCASKVVISGPFCSNGICSAKNVVNYRSACIDFCYIYECPPSGRNMSSAIESINNELSNANSSLEEVGKNCNCNEICVK